MYFYSKVDNKTYYIYMYVQKKKRLVFYLKILTVSLNIPQ